MKSLAVPENKLSIKQDGGDDKIKTKQRIKDGNIRRH
jgi:hypothetical protein